MGSSGLNLGVMCATLVFATAGTVTAQTTVYDGDPNDSALRGAPISEADRDDHAAGDGIFFADCTCEMLQPLTVGDTLYAAIDNPQGNDQILAGDPCTVMCGRFFSGGEEDLILGAWNIDNGHDGFDACDCPDFGMAPFPTGWYVFCNELTLDPPNGGEPDCVCPELQPLLVGDTLYAAVDNPDGNEQILAGDPCTVICGQFFGPGQGGGDEDYILGSWKIDNGHDGFGDCDCPADGSAEFPTGWYVICSELTAEPPVVGEVDCVCEDLQPLNVGDILFSSVDAPQGNEQISIGDEGTLVCGRFFGGGDEDIVLLEWDIDNGHNGLGACDCPEDGVAESPRGWYVFCSQVTPVDPKGMTPVDCVCEDLQPLFVGDTLVAIVDEPQGNEQILIGDEGTLVCGRFFDGGEEDVLLIEWDIDNGHDGFSSCDCPADGVAIFPTGWYVFCNEVGVPEPPSRDCDGDIDGDCDVDTEDLLILLAAFGPCELPGPGFCPADLNSTLR